MSAVLDPSAFDDDVHAQVAEGWVVQVFALGSDSVAAAGAMIELALLDEQHTIAESTDGLDAYLIVETRHDVEVMDAVRVAVATADPHASLEHVAGGDEDAVVDGMPEAAA